MSNHLDTPYHASSLVLSWYNRKMASKLRIQRTYESIEAIWALIYTHYYTSDLPNIEYGICDLILERDLLSERVRNTILCMRKDILAERWTLPDHIRNKMFVVNKEKTFHLQLFEKVLTSNSEMLDVIDGIYSKSKRKLPQISEQIFRWELLLFYRLSKHPGIYKTHLMKSTGYKYPEIIGYIDALIADNVLKVVIGDGKYFSKADITHTGIMLNRLHPVIMEFNSVTGNKYLSQGVR